MMVTILLYSIVYYICIFCKQYRGKLAIDSGGEMTFDTRQTMLYNGLTGLSETEEKET